MGVEPTTFRLTAECSNQLSYQAQELAKLALGPIINRQLRWRSYQASLLLKAADGPIIIVAAQRPHLSYQASLLLKAADGPIIIVAAQRPQLSYQAQELALLALGPIINRGRWPRSYQASLPLKAKERPSKRLARRPKCLLDRNRTNDLGRIV